MTRYVLRYRLPDTAREALEAYIASAAPVLRPDHPIPSIEFDNLEAAKRELARGSEKGGWAFVHTKTYKRARDAYRDLNFVLFPGKYHAQWAFVSFEVIE